MYHINLKSLYTKKRKRFFPHEIGLAPSHGVQMELIWNRSLFRNTDSCKWIKFSNSLYI